MDELDRRDGQTATRPVDAMTDITVQPIARLRHQQQQQLDERSASAASVIHCVSASSLPHLQHQ